MKAIKLLIKIVIVGSVLTFAVAGIFEWKRSQQSALHSLRVVDKENSIGRYSGFHALWGYTDNGNYICVPVPSTDRYEIGKTYYFNLRNHDIENGMPGFGWSVFLSVVGSSVATVLLLWFVGWIIYRIVKFAWT